MEGLTTHVVPAPGSSTVVIVDEQTQIGGARRSAVEIGHANGLSADAIGRLAIVVTEAATNITRHAGHGRMVFRALEHESNAAVEVLALDKGPGIADVRRAMRDGYSTSGTAGLGLGSMQRLSELFALYSQPESGTALVARVGERRRLPGPRHRVF